MRSTAGLNIGVFNFGVLGRSGGMGRYKLPKNTPESTELSVFPGLIFRNPCHVMIAQEAAGLLDEYIHEAIDGKTKGIVVHSTKGAPALAVLCRGHETAYIEVIEHYQSVQKKKSAPPEEKPRLAHTCSFCSNPLRRTRSKNRG